MPSKEVVVRVSFNRINFGRSKVQANTQEQEKVISLLKIVQNGGCKTNGCKRSIHDSEIHRFELIAKGEDISVESERPCLVQGIAGSVLKAIEEKKIRIEAIH